MKKILLLAIPMLFLFTMCKKDEIEPKKEDNIELGIIIGDNTKVLKLEDRDAIVSIDITKFDFTAKKSSVFFSSLAVNDIIVDSTSIKTPYGYMRKVTSIEDNGSNLTIHTEQAKLYQAIKQGSFNLRTNKLKNSDIKSIILEPGVSLGKKSDTNFRAFEFDFDTTFGTGDNGIYVSGNTFLDVGFFWELDWSLLPPPAIPPFEIDLFTAGVEIDQGASINVIGTGSYTDTEQIRFAYIEFTPITIMVGPVPLIFIPRVEFFINVKGEISASITTGASETFSSKLGILYENSEWTGIYDTNFNTKYIVPKVETNTSVTASVEPRAGLFLYGIAGPVVGVEAYTKIIVKSLPQSKFNIDYDLGIKAYAGVVLTAFGIDILDKKIDLFDLPKNLYKIENGTTQESISIISPTNGSKIGIGEIAEITTYYSGGIPQKVEFYVNNVLIGSDEEAPFNFLWDTSGLQTGEYQLKAKLILSNRELESDLIEVSLVTAGWDIYNLNKKISGLPMYMGLKDIFILDESNIWINGDSGNLFYSNNAGDSWEWINSSGKVETAPIFIDSNRGYSFDTSYELVNTNNGGLTWNDNNPINSFLGEEIVVDHSSNSDLIMYGRSGGNEALVLYDVDSETVFSTILFSDHDISTSFQDGFVPRPKMISNSSGLIIPNLKKDGSTKRYLGNYKNGQFNLIDVGLNNDEIIVDLFFINENDGWFTSSLNQLYKTNDGGNNWTKTFDGSSILGGYEVKVFFVDHNTGYWIDTYSGVNKSKLYRTDDGGITWNPIDGFKGLVGLNDVKFYGKNLGFVIGGGDGTFADDGSYKIYRYHKG